MRNEYFSTKLVTKADDAFQLFSKLLKQIDQNLISNKNSFFKILFNKQNELLDERYKCIKSFNDVYDDIYMLLRDSLAKPFYNKFKDKYLENEFINNKEMVNTLLNIMIDSDNDMLLYGLNVDYEKTLRFQENKKFEKIMFADSFLNTKKTDALIEYVENNITIFEYFVDCLDENEIEKVNVNADFRGIKTISNDRSLLFNDFINNYENSNLFYKYLASYLIINSDFDSAFYAVNRPEISGEKYVTIKEEEYINNFEELYEKYNNCFNILSEIDFNECLKTADKNVLLKYIIQKPSNELYSLLKFLKKEYVKEETNTINVNINQY